MVAPSPSRTSPDISFIVVTWNVRDRLERCLQSIQRQASSSGPSPSRAAVQPPFTSEIWVVDNVSTDGSLDMLRSEFPDVRVIANAENVGFARGNNQALATAQGRYLFLLNPDTELLPGAVCTLLGYMDEHPRVGLVGPRLCDSDGSLRSSRRRFPTFCTAFLESTRLQQWFPRNRILSRYYMLDTADDAIQQVDWVTGAALFARRELYDQIGGLDESFFMYSEELDWCYRARRASWQIVYLPTASVIHHEAQSSSQVLARRDIYFHSSKIRFFRKYHGALTAEILRAFLLLMFALQLFEEGTKWVLGHKRPLRAARIQAHWQVLKSGLR